MSQHSLIIFVYSYACFVSDNLHGTPWSQIISNPPKCTSKLKLYKAARSDTVVKFDDFYSDEVKVERQIFRMRCVATLFQRLNSVTVKNVLRRALARQVRANKTRIFCIPNISERTNKLLWRSVDDKSLMGDLVPSSDAAGRHGWLRFVSNERVLLGIFVLWERHWEKNIGHVGIWHATEQAVMVARRLGNHIQEYS